MVGKKGYPAQQLSILLVDIKRFPYFTFAVYELKSC